MQQPKPWQIVLSAMLGVGLLLMMMALGVVGTSQTKEVIVSPDRRYGLLLLHDEFLGQTESLVVVSYPGSRDEREIFRRVGDRPFAFVGWRAEGAALLKVADEGELTAREVLLRCADDHCRIEP